jgi:hypothetical protein
MQRMVSFIRRGLPIVAAVAVTAVVVRFAISPVQAQTESGEPYRVELVHNDPYKIQSALNSMAKQGWYYISCTSRTDTKVLLVFRKSN